MVKSWLALRRRRPAAVLAVPRWRAPTSGPSWFAAGSSPCGNVPSRLDRRRSGFLFRLHFFLSEPDGDSKLPTIERRRGVIPR